MISPIATISLTDMPEDEFRALKGAVAEAAKQIAHHGIWRDSPDRLKERLESIQGYLSSNDPLVLVAAYLLELSGYRRAGDDRELDSWDWDGGQEWQLGAGNVVSELS